MSRACFLVTAAIVGLSGCSIHNAQLVNDQRVCERACKACDTCQARGVRRDDQVWVQVTEPTPTLGRGVVVAHNRVLTCAHVVHAATSIRVLAQGEIYAAVVLDQRLDKGGDWALLQLPPRAGLSPRFDCVTDYKPRHGELLSVILSENPKGILYSMNEREFNAISVREVQGVVRNIRLKMHDVENYGDPERVPPDCLFHLSGVEANPGDSGSPVYDGSGRLVGILEGKVPSSEFGLCQIQPIPEVVITFPQIPTGEHFSAQK